VDSDLNTLPNTYAGVQYLRGVAALMVVIFHVTAILPGTGPSWSRGQIGVDLFFVISGFVMWISGRHLSAAGFAKRRLLRIVPLYWAVTLVLYLVSTDGGRLSGPTDPPIDLFRSLFFIAYDSGNVPRVSPIVSPGWTLNLEMAFYAIFTLGLLVQPKRLLAIVTLCIAGIAVVGLFVPDTLPVARFYTDTIVLEFLAGVWLARLVTLGRMPGPAVSSVFLIAGTLTVLWPIAPPSGLRFVDWGLPAVLVVTGVVGLEPWLSRKKLWLPTLLGDASYSIYLTHITSIAVIAILPELVAPWPVAISVVFCVVIGLGAFWMFERPVNSLLRALFEAPPATAPRYS